MENIAPFLTTDNLWFLPALHGGQFSISQFYHVIFYFLRKLNKK